MKYLQLSSRERYAIAALRHEGLSLRAVARRLDRAPSSISRELRRNATTHDGHYRPEKAQQYAVARRRRSRRNLRYGPQDWAPIARAIRTASVPFKTITLDNGTEFHDYETVEARTGVPFYFATPYHSWERGTNENTNGLVRQYLPKGMCLRTLTQTECGQIAKALNSRPKDRHGFRTPSEVLFSRP